MADSPKVSIIVPVYNAEKYLAECIDSLLKQTLEEIEIILVDDGSKDKSSQIIDDYASSDSRLKTVHVPNGGPSRARNIGISMASGQYLGFVDSDDYAVPTMFETLYTTASNNHSDITICEYASVVGHTAQHIDLQFNAHYSSAEEVKSELIQRYYTGEHTGLYSLWNKLFARELICDFDLRLDETLYRAEDAWFVFDCLKHASHISFVDECLYYYRQNDSSIMHTVKKDQFNTWAATKERLLVENETLHFNVDYHAFYGNFLYNTAVFFRYYLARGEAAFVKGLFQNATFQKAIHYRKKVPLHVRALHGLVAHHMNRLAIFLYKAWGKLTNG